MSPPSGTSKPMRVELAVADRCTPSAVPVAVVDDSAFALLGLIKLPRLLRREGMRKMPDCCLLGELSCCACECEGVCSVCVVGLRMLLRVRFGWACSVEGPALCGCGKLVPIRKAAREDGRGAAALVGEGASGLRDCISTLGSAERGVCIVALRRMLLRPRPLPRPVSTAKWFSLDSRGLPEAAAAPPPAPRGVRPADMALAWLTEALRMRMCMAFFWRIACFRNSRSLLSSEAAWAAALDEADSAATALPSAAAIITPDPAGTRPDASNIDVAGDGPPLPRVPGRGPLLPRRVDVPGAPASDRAARSAALNSLPLTSKESPC